MTWNSRPELRPYQAQLVESLYQKIESGLTRLAIIAGTGAGKTIISGQICADAHAQPGCRVLFMVHLNILVAQTAEKLQAFGLPCGFIKAGYEENPNARIQVASIQTMAQREWWQRWPADVVFYDEGHITLFSQVGQTALEIFPEAVHLAMTATPERLGRAQLGDYLQGFVAAPPPAALQQMGFLSSMKYFALPPADLSQVATIGGDFDSAGLRNACNRPELIQKIVAEWFRLTHGKRTIAFCVDVEHAQAVAAAFQAAGVAAASVSGDTGRDDRRQLYQRLREGRLLVLTSCNVISIGFDEPSVEVGLLLRPTQSHALHIQQVGRVMRVCHGKPHGVILDQAGNLQRLGKPEDTTSYHLPKRRRGGGRRREMRRKTCPTCHQSHPQFVKRCGCGYRWGKAEQVNDGDLVEIYSPAQARQITDPRLLRDSFHAIRRRLFAAGYDLGLAEQEFEAQTGRQPAPEWYQGSILGSQARLENCGPFRQYLEQCARSQGRSQAWVEEALRLELGLERQTLEASC